MTKSVLFPLFLLFLLCAFSFSLCGQYAPEGPNTNPTSGPPMKAFDYRLFRDGSGNTQYVCISPSRGKTSSASIVTATNVSPIVVTTSLAAGLFSDYQVTISGVTGNTAANGTFTVTVIDSTHISLNGTTGNGAYTGGGTATTQAPLLTDSVWAIRRMYYTGSNLDASVWLAGSTSMNQSCANRASISAQ